MSRSPRCNSPQHEYPKREALQRRRTPEQQVHSDERMTVLAALALFLVLGVVVSLHQVLPVNAGYEDRGDAGGSAAPDGYMVQAVPDGAVAGLGKAMPRTPLQGQKLEPCDVRIEKTINGACWMELTTAPSTDACGDKAYLYKGKCYVAVAPARKPDVSFSE